MKVFYSRVSSSDGSQKHDRQLIDLTGFDYVFSDSCSGSIDLFDRPKGSQIKRLIDQGKLKHLEIHAIDRLGRSALSILDNYNYLTQQGVRIVCRNPQLSNFNDEGKPDPFSDLLLNLFASIAQYERSLIVSRITQPASQSTNITNNAQFIVGSSGSNAIYQWQTNLGFGFQNLNNAGQYNGTTSSTLSVLNLSMSNNNQVFRCIISSGSCTDTSAVAVLTVVNNAGINNINA